VKGQEVVTPPAAEPAKVIDIMEALKRSLAIAKKPPASVEALEAEAPKQKSAGKKQRTAPRLTRRPSVSEQAAARPPENQFFICAPRSADLPLALELILGTGKCPR